MVASQYYESHYDLRQSKLAMENLEFIVVDFPIKTFIHSGFPIAVFDCQRASHFLYTAYYLKNKHSAIQYDESYTDFCQRYFSETIIMHHDFQSFSIS